MSLANVLKKVLSNSSPTTVAAAAKTTLRVITEEDYANEVAALNHFQKLNGLEDALKVLQTKLRKVKADVTTLAGRASIMGGTAVNATPADEDKLLQTLKSIQLDFKNTTIQFNDTLTELGNQAMNVSYRDVNLLFSGDITSFAAFGNKIPDTPGVYKEDPTGNPGYLVGFIEYLTLRNNAIIKRLAIANGPNNDNDAALRQKLDVNYWSDPARLDAALNLFIAKTKQREDLISIDYTQSRGIAKSQQLTAQYDQMPEPDSEDVRKLKTSEIQALIDAVAAAQGAITSSAALTSQAQITYATVHGQQAATLDGVTQLGTAQEVTTMSAARTKAEDTIKKYDVTYDPSAKALTELEPLAKRWKDAVNEYNKVHNQGPSYYKDQNPQGRILANLEQDNKDREVINRDNNVVALYTNTTPGNAANLRDAQALAPTNAAWKTLVTARATTLKKAADLFLNEDFPGQLLSSLTNPELEQGILPREQAVTELSKWAQGAAFSDIVSNPLADMIAKTKARETVVRELEKHMPSGSEFNQLLTQDNAKIVEALRQNKIKYDETAAKINKITGANKAYDWNNASQRGLEDIITELKDAERNRERFINEYKGLINGGALPMNFAVKTIPEIRDAINQVKEDAIEDAFKKAILARIDKAKAAAITGESDIPNLNTEIEIKNMEDGLNGILSDLLNYGASALDQMVTDKRLKKLSRDEVLAEQKAVVNKIDKLLTELAGKKASLVAQVVRDKQRLAFLELNKYYDNKPGIVLESSDVVTLSLTRNEVLAKLQLQKANDEKTYPPSQLLTDFQAFAKGIDGYLFLDKYTNIDRPHSSGHIGFIKTFEGSDGKKVQLCGNTNSPFSSCSIGFFHGGVFHSDWARVVPNVYGNAVLGAVVPEVQKNLAELSKALKRNPAAASEDLTKLTMPLYINLIDRHVVGPLAFINEVIEDQEYIIKQSGLGTPIDKERRSQARDQSNNAIAFAFRDGNVVEDIPLDEVLDNGGTADEVTYLIAPSGSKNQADGSPVMLKWFNDVINTGKWTNEPIRKAVQKVVDKLYPKSIYDDKDERTDGAAGGKIDFVSATEPQALAALKTITDNYKSSLRIIRFVKFDNKGAQIEKSPGNPQHLKALWQSDYDVKAFDNIREVTGELRKQGIMVWADTNDLNDYNGAQAVSTAVGGATQEYLLDTDDEDVVSFRFTPNI